MLGPQEETGTRVTSFRESVSDCVTALLRRVGKSPPDEEQEDRGRFLRLPGEVEKEWH